MIPIDFKAMLSTMHKVTDWKASYLIPTVFLISEKGMQSVSSLYCTVILNKILKTLK